VEETGVPGENHRPVVTEKIQFTNKNKYLERQLYPTSEMKPVLWQK